jgi:hypothetical protein
MASHTLFRGILILQKGRPMRSLAWTHLLLVGLLLLVSRSASAQINLEGSWAPRMHEDWMERCCGRDLVDYTGTPLNDDARAKAVSWDASLNSLRERQCLLFSPWAGQFQPQGVRIWSETGADGKIIAWKMSGNVQKDVITIWMDGRPHPSPNAFYPFSGFSTGQWEGDTLTVRTTHMKTAVTRRANGVPRSDQAVTTAHIVRHDNLLTVLTIEEDPVYLTEPLVVSRTFELDTRGDIEKWTTCEAVTEVPRLEDSGIVPHYLSGENPNEHYMEETYHVPPAAAMGHAETLYPEYRLEIANTYQRPGACERYCCGWIGVGGGSVNPAPGLDCITDRLERESAVVAPKQASPASPAKK